MLIDLDNVLVDTEDISLAFPRMCTDNRIRWKVLLKGQHEDFEFLISKEAYDKLCKYMNCQLNMHMNPAVKGSDTNG